MNSILFLLCGRRPNTPALMPCWPLLSTYAGRLIGGPALVCSLRPMDDGRGSISGGCLESDVAKKAWWWTETGPVVRTYDTGSDDDGKPQFGLGCHGVIRVLMERLGKPDSNAAIAFLNRCRIERKAGVMATVIASPSPDVARVGSRWFLAPDGYTDGDIADLMVRDWTEAEADAALWERRSRMLLVPHSLGNVEVFVELIAPPVPLFVFGAGPDVAPVVRIAKEIGWHVTVVDARHAQPHPGKFQEADAVIRTSIEQPLDGISIDRHSVAVVMNHSYPVDASVLHALMDARPEFIGMLGPRSRTGRMLEELEYRQRTRFATCAGGTRHRRRHTGTDCTLDRRRDSDSSNETYGEDAAHTSGRASSLISTFEASSSLRLGRSRQ